MNCLEERILKDGIVKEGNVLKVDSFLNHQMDIDLFNEMGKEWKKRFEGANINKILTIEASGISTGEQVAFLTLTCSLFWMLSYITSHVNVIMLRRKMKNVPRNFKTPLFPLLQIVGIALQVYMMFNISTDPVQRRNIYILCFVLFAALFIYAFIWVKYRLKLPLLKGIGVHQVMMMESPEYHRVHSDLKNENNTNMGT